MVGPQHATRVSTGPWINFSKSTIGYRKDTILRIVSEICSELLPRNQTLGHKHQYNVKAPSESIVIDVERILPSECPTEPILHVTQTNRRGR
jgi:hypothetical protein